MINGARILVVDDEKDIVELVTFHLEQKGFSVLKAGDGETALSILFDENVDLLILDLMLPGMNGLEVLKSLREHPRIAGLPVILLTAKAAEVDKIVGFEMGTDDYLTKPFSVKELVARVEALLRRAGGFNREGAFSAMGFAVDFRSHKASVNGAPVELSPREFAILEFLHSHRGRVMSRRQILEKAFGMDAAAEERAVDVNLARLRDKMGPAKAALRTVKGYGYCLDPAAAGKNGGPA